MTTFGALLAHFFRFQFLVEIRSRFLWILVIFLVPKSLPKTTSERLSREKVDFQKPLFYSSKTIFLDFGAFPGTPKIVSGSAFKIQCDFASILTPKMTPPGLPFGTIFVSEIVAPIDPGHFFVECAPQSPPNLSSSKRKAPREDELNGSVCCLLFGFGA